MDVYYLGPDYGGSSMAIIFYFFNGGVYVDYSYALFVPTSGQTIDDFEDSIVAAAAAYAAGNSWTISNSQKWYPRVVTATRNGLMSPAQLASLNAIIASAPSSIQTTVSQTGTNAPTNNITPINTYTGTPSLTWARTSAGVYTLTAGSAIFNTSGKTGVFIQPPTNLNGSFRAVVTSTTVITITTAIQSLAILGLLGFTATPTDGMLDKTMIYIQTYP